MTKEEALQLLESEDKGDVRYGIEELQKFEEPDVIKAIVAVVNKFKMKSITEAAKETLMSFKNLSKDVIDESLMLFACEEPKVRAMAIEVIASFWNDSVSHIEVLTKNSDYNMRKYGVDVLALVPTRKSLEDLAALINDVNPNVKYSAIEALAFFEAHRERVREILEVELKKVDTTNLYGLVSVIQAITKGAYRSNQFSELATKKIDGASNFAKHYLYKLLLAQGDTSILEAARENAKSINLLHEWDKDECFFVGKSDRC